MSNYTRLFVPDPRRSGSKLSEKETVDVSKIEPQDIVVARKWWRANAPAQYKELLDAQEKPAVGTE